MKANELRLNNFVELDNEICKVTKLELDSIGVTRPNMENFVTLYTKPNGIPLTEEWLLKFGFEISIGGISYDKGKLSIYLGETILSNENGTTYFNSWKILEYSPKYVHQLQNLYFALTGEELTLQP